MRVTVIGGGLAGLACTAELVRASVEVVVLEAADRFGGQLRTTRDGDFLVESGAAALDHAEMAGAAWTRELDVADGLIERHSLPTLVLLNGALDRVHTGETAALFGTPAGSDRADRRPLSFADGMESLIRGIVRTIADRADLRSGTAAVALAPHADGWTVHPEMGGAFISNAIVLALPPRAAAWLVHPASATAARPLTGLSARAVVVVSLGYARDAVAHPLDAAGFTVPLDAREAGLHSCAFASSEFAGRSPRDAVLLRAVIQPARGELAGTTEAEWTVKAAELLAPVLGIRGDPIGSWVARWPEALPDYGPDYAAHVVEARETLRDFAPGELAGAAYDDWGIDGAIHSGRAAAARLLGTLRPA